MRESIALAIPKLYMRKASRRVPEPDDFQTLVDLGIVRRNVNDDALQISQRVTGEEDFVIHCGICLRASSNETRFPRSSDFKPSSTACRNSNS